MKAAIDYEVTTDFGQKGSFNELINIAEWWEHNCQDEVNGGFIGEVCADGRRNITANKGIILNARILWFFSEVAIYTGNHQYRELANRVFEYIVAHFNDEKHGGALWEVDFRGNVVNDRKQTYAQCFCIYAFCAYFRLSGNETARTLSLQYFQLVQEHMMDQNHGGYIEALDREWQPVSDHRLSPKDLNYPKSMNTHLHVLEAFAALYNTFPTSQTEVALRYVIDIFEFKILDDKTYHLKLFFENNWVDRSQTWSFGHDIEASWLMWEAAEFLNDSDVLKRLKPKVIKIAEICLDEAIGDLGQVCDDFDLVSKHKSQHSEWWVQAEALVGFFNAYQLSGDIKLRDICEPIWQFIQDYHLDNINGEWHWFAELPQVANQQNYKVGFWKAPYHNGRAMMELSKRLHVTK